MKTVLVGESNYAEFEVLNDFLTGKGFKVHWVKNGLDAVNAFGETLPDLMILDALIPGLTGIKVCQRIKKQPGGDDVKTILLSKVYRQFKAQYESRTKVGVDAYSEKPVNVAELEKVIEDLLGAEPAEPAAPAVESAPVMTEPEAPIDETRRTLGTAGSLSETPFPKLLYFLFKFRRTGALRVTHEHISKVLYLREGNPAFVTSNLSNESLGRFMVQRGTISVEDYNTSLQKMLETGKQQGAVLIEMQTITPHQLFEALEAQVREKILRIFAWDTGEYEFRSGRFDIDQSQQLNIPAMSVILEGIKRFYTLTRLERYFNEYKNQKLIKVPGSMLETGALAFKPSEAKFVTLVDGKRTVGKIIALSNLSLSETFQILYFMLLTEVIRFVGDPGFGSRGEQEHQTFVEEKRKRRDELRRLAEDKTGVHHDRTLAYRRAVARTFEVIDKLNYYDLFNVPRTASTERIKQAYHTLTRKYHPYDLYNQADEVLKAKSDGIFRSLTAAYETLIDDVKRTEYDKTLAAEQAEGAPEPEAPTKLPIDDFDFADEVDYAATSAAGDESLDGPDIEWDVGADLAAEAKADTEHELESFEADDESVREASEVAVSMANVVKSELVFQEGEDALYDEEFAKARELFNQALELNPKEAEYFAYLGWATFRENPGDEANVAAGRDLMEKAISINPGLDNAYAFLGMLELHQGQKDRAREFFEKALQYNPDNLRAQAELKKLEVG